MTQWNACVEMTTFVNRRSKFERRLTLHGASLAEAAAHPRAFAEGEGLVFIHPYDDDAIIAGQGTLALELIEDVTGLDTLAVPVGGGGLLAGSAIAAQGAGRSIEIFGVEVESYTAMAQELAGSPVDVGGATIAEGIAVRDIGRKPLGIARKFVERVLIVPEQAIENAIALLAEEAKVVAEGAGAAALAALLTYSELFRGRRVGVPICGANIDNRALANVLQRV
jgi:threonine dehydratase